MGRIVKFPAQSTKFGYRRVRKRARVLEDPAQLHLFPQATATVLQLAGGLGSFEQALMLDEREDPQAVEYYLRAIAENDCAADAYCNLGIIESKLGRTAKALDYLTSSLKQNPRHAEAHYNLGNLYFEANDLRLAQLHYEMTVEVDPSFPNVFFNLGLVLAISKELEAAVTALTKYQEMVPGEEGRKADELLGNLRKSLAASKKPHTGAR